MDSSILFGLVRYIYGKGIEKNIEGFEELISRYRYNGGVYQDIILVSEDEEKTKL